MDRTEPTDEDEGKKVVNANGEKIGIVSEVSDGTAMVNPDPGITDTITSKLGWGEADEGDYKLSLNRIHTITDDEIRLKE